MVDASALRTRREAAGLSQAQVARALEVGTEVVYNWERGRHVPQERRLAQIAGVLGVDVGALLVDGPRDLRRLRWLAGCNAVEAAQAAGVTPTTWARWESGRVRRIPDTVVLGRLERLFKVSAATVESGFRMSQSRS